MTACNASSSSALSCGPLKLMDPRDIGRWSELKAKPRPWMGVRQYATPLYCKGGTTGDLAGLRSISANLAFIIKA